MIEINLNKIYNIDCLQGLKSLGNDSINLTVTKIVTRKHTYFSRVMNWHNSFAKLNFFLIQTIKKRKKNIFFSK